MATTWAAVVSVPSLVERHLRTRQPLERIAFAAHEKLTPPSFVTLPMVAMMAGRGQYERAGAEHHEDGDAR